MSTVYITEHGAVVRLSSRTLIITKGKEKLAQIPLIGVDNILIFGNAQVSTQAVSALLEEGVDITYLSPQGKLRGRLVSTASKNVLLRVAQYERYLDDDFQINLARVILKAKMRNGKKVIKRQLYNHPELNVQNELDTIDKSIKQVDHRKTINSMMGDEGVASAAYFKTLGRLVRRSFAFEKRSRRPPYDPVNALLSFGYTLLTNEIFSLLHAHGFDPYIGYLHGIVYGRPSLALDVVEEFRHPVIDRFVLYLINQQKLTESDFQDKKPGIYLTEEGLKRFFKEYNKLKKRTFQSFEQKLPLHDIIKRQIRCMSKTLLKNEPYKPFVFKI